MIMPETTLKPLKDLEVKDFRNGTSIITMRVPTKRVPSILKTAQKAALSEDEWMAYTAECWGAVQDQIETADTFDPSQSE